MSDESALQLFFDEIGKRPLLTAAQEIDLAKRIERGDLAAKRRMIESNSGWWWRSRSPIATAG